MKDKILKIAYFVTAFVLAGAIILNGVTVPVLASSEVESLPRTDVDVNVSYDSDYIYMNYDGSIYTLPISVSLKSSSKWLAYYRSDGEPYYYAITSSVANYTNKNGNYIIPFSFWFSPSEYRVYVFSGYNTSSFSEPVGKVVSYYDGTFVFDLANAYLYLSYYDLNDMSFNPLGVVSLDGTDDKRGGVYPKMRIGTNGLFSKYNSESGSSVNFPTDLLCVYSNMDISGFYKLDNQSIYTPDYYFDNQYLFYVEGVGYTFIDSAENLVDVVNRSDGYAYLDFFDIGNRRVWTSIDGVSWSYSNKVQNMYGDEIQIEYQWLYDSVGSDASFIAKLVYTTDLEYGQEPLVKPEYGDINDVVSDLNDLIIGGAPEDSGGRGDGYTIDDITNMHTVEYYEFIAYGFTHEYYRKLTIHYGDGTTEYVYDINSGRHGSFNPGDRAVSYISIEYIPTVAMYMYDMNLTLDDTNSLIRALYTGMQAVFDNISLTNTYMESIDLAISDLPDYTKQFNESIGIQKDILAALEGLEGSAPSVSIDIDKTYLDSWLSELDSSIDNVAGLVAMDEMTDVFDTVVDSSGNTVGTLSTFLDDVVKDENTLMQLDEVGVYVSSAMSSITKLKVLDSAFTYAGGLSNGIGFINAYADSFYNASGNYAPVFIVGSAMVCVNMFVRRRE